MRSILRGFAPWHSMVFVAWAIAGCSTTISSVLPDATTGDASDAAVASPHDADAVAPAVDPLADAPRCPPTDIAEPVIDAPGDAAPHVVEVAAGSQWHTCARMSDGTLRCMGQNRTGALGIPGVDEAERPMTVPGLTGVAQVVTWNVDATCTRHIDGRVRCWGQNRYHIVGNGHVGDEVCGGNPCRRTPMLVEGLDDVTHLAASTFSMCAVRADGSVWCWGSSLFPERMENLTRPTRMPSLRDVVWMRATLFGWLMRRRDGSYLSTDFYIPAPPGNALLSSNVVSTHACHRLPDTSVRCVGTNPNGKLGQGSTSYSFQDIRTTNPGLCGVRSVHTGAYHSCALMLSGDTWCWGDAAGGIGVPPTGECAGIIGPSRCSEYPQRVEGIDRVVALFPGIWETWAIREDRSVWVWSSANGDRPTRVDW